MSVRLLLVSNSVTRSINALQTIAQVISEARNNGGARESYSRRKDSRGWTAAKPVVAEVDGDDDSLYDQDRLGLTSIAQCNAGES